MSSSSMVCISSQWQVLGPFQIGTREATWGADPLEIYGGFRSLNKPAARDEGEPEELDLSTPPNIDRSSYLTSSLTNNALTGWSTLEALSTGAHHSHAAGSGSHSLLQCSDSIQLSCAFGDGFDWSQMVAIYGWASLQYQAWIRGNLTVKGSGVQTVVLYTEGALELYIDGHHHFGGDLYQLRRVPLVLQLDPGPHQLDLRLVRDVRANGGIGSPKIDVSIRAGIATPGLSITADSVLMPDCLIERNDFASSYGSVMVRNDHNQDLEIVKLRPTKDNLSISIVNDRVIRIIPGQTRPVAFEIKSHSDCPESVSFSVQYKSVENNELSEHTQVITTAVRRKSILSPHKITYLHPGGIISKAIIQPPVWKTEMEDDASNAKTSESKAFLAPVLLQLHGSGVDPENPMVADSLTSLDLHAWTVFPAGVTPWTGDDWHQWGFYDVKAAVDALSTWIDRNKWSQGPIPALDSWMVTGHSNGGQGTWYTMTHQPDYVFAGAPVAGYSSIQNYVSYDLWQPMDPTIRSILDGSLATYRHELLVSNMQGIRIHSQHGRADDNVPIFHARLMKHLLSQAGIPSSYTELPGKNHFFDGIMSTEPLQHFYREELDGNHTRPNSSLNFNLTVARPADTGPMYGVHVHSLNTPGRLGKVSVSIVHEHNSSKCKVRTTNIRRLSVPWSDQYCSDLQIDGQSVRISPGSQQSVFFQDSKHTWRNASSEERITISQYGGMDNILRTQGRFCILADDASRKIALQISRNLCQYFYADTEIRSLNDTSAMQGCGNRINVFQRSSLDLTSTRSDSVPRTGNDKPMLSIMDHDGNVYTYDSKNGLGAVYLHDTGSGDLELDVWGSDARGLEIAARLVPMLTGVGQPDFVIADKTMLEQGAGGVLAMGFFIGLLPGDLTASTNSYFT